MRIATSNIEDYIKGKMLDYAVDKRENYSRIFYHGIVVNNVDPNNSKRIQVRIPIIDDRYYINNSKEEGDKLLPWVLPFNKNFIDTPENNTIVIVGLMDPKVPYYGRIFLDSITDISAKDIFDYTRLTPEIKNYNNWENSEKQLDIIIKSKPKNSKEFSSKESISYPTGIRGKGNNKIVLDQASITIIQNAANRKTESFIKLAEDINLEAANNITITSKKGEKTYHPVFDQPLYDYLSYMNDFLKSIINVMASKPSINNMNLQADLPSPSVPSLVSKLTSLYSKFNKLKVPGQGASKYITIN